MAQDMHYLPEQKLLFLLEYLVFKHRFVLKAKAFLWWKSPPSKQQKTTEHKGVMRLSFLQVAALLQLEGNSDGLPDVWGVVYKAALAFAKAAAVDEMLGNLSASLQSYAKVTSLSTPGSSEDASRLGTSAYQFFCEMAAQQTINQLNPKQAFLCWKGWAR